MPKSTSTAPPIVAISLGVNELILYGSRLTPGQVYASSWSFAPGAVGSDGPVTATGEAGEKAADSSGNVTFKVPTSAFPSEPGKFTWWLHLPGSEAVVASSFRYVG